MNVVKPSSSFLTLSCVAATGLLASLSVNAQSSYQYENSISYLKYEMDTLPEDKYENWVLTLGGVTYFAPVNTTRGPLAEAAFISRASGVRLTYSRSDIDAKIAWMDEEVSSEYTTDNAVLSVDYYVPNTIFYLSLGVSAAKTKFSSRRISNGTIIRHSDSGKWDYQGIASLGVTPVNNLLLWSNFYEGQDVSDDWNVNGKYLLLLNGERALNFQVGYSVENDEDYGDIANPSISSDYYFNKTFSVGVAYYLTDYEYVDDEHTYELRARKFFSESISVQASFAKLEDDRTALIGASYRF